MVDLDPSTLPPAEVGDTTPRTTSSTLLIGTLVLLTTTTSVVTSLGGSLVPVVAREYDVSLGAAQWILTGPMLVGAIATPVLGRLGGTGRRRPVILASLGLVALGLGLTTLPTRFPGLVVGRLFQGIGIALLPLALAVARDNLPRRRATKALALLSVTTTAGAGISYPLSAWLALTLGLDAAYLFALVITLVTLMLAWRTVPGATTRGADTVHWTGALLLGAGTLLLLLAITQAPHLDTRSPVLWGMVTAGVAALLAWVAVTLRHDKPLVDLRLAAHRKVLSAHISALTSGVAVYMLFALTMIQVQLPTSTGFGLGLPVTAAGMILAPYAFFSFIGSRVSTALARQIGLDLILPIGATLYGAATVVYALTHHSIWAVAMMMALSGLASGFTFSVMPGLVLRSTPPAETGSALSFNVLLRFIGFAAGSSLGTAVLALLASHMTYAVAFRTTVWVNAALWAVTALISLALVPSNHRAAELKETP